MENENKLKQLEKVLTNVATRSSKPLIYIASGFFNDIQKQGVEELEKLFDAQSANYFSPRQHTVDFSKSPNKTVLIERIFKSNVDNIKASEEIYVLLDQSNRGMFDVGTVWELGYAVVDYSVRGISLDNIHVQLKTEGLDFVFTEMIKSIQNLVAKKDELFKEFSKDVAVKNRLLLWKDNAVNLEESIEMLGYNLVPVLLDSLLKSTDSLLTKLASSRGVVFNIDNYPPQIPMMMGAFYALGIKHQTMSIQGFDSNVMLIPSTEGHLKLPALYDASKSNTKID